MQTFSKFRAFLIKIWNYLKSAFFYKRKEINRRVPKRDEFLPSPPISTSNITSAGYGAVIRDPIFYAVDDHQPSKFQQEDGDDLKKREEVDNNIDYNFSVIVKKILSKLGVDPDKYDSITWVDIELVHGKKMPVGIIVIDGDHPGNTRDDMLTVIILTKMDVNFAHDLINDIERDYDDNDGENDYDFIKNVDEECYDSDDGGGRVMLYLSKIVLPRKLAVAFSKIILGS